ARQSRPLVVRYKQSDLLYLALLLKMRRKTQTKERRKSLSLLSIVCVLSSPVRPRKMKCHQTRRRKRLILTAVNQRSWSEKYAEKGQLVGERSTMYIGMVTPALRPLGNPLRM